LEDEPLLFPNLTTLGILGHSTAKKWNRDSVANSIMNPILSEIGKIPEVILIPAEGDTGILVQGWAEGHRTACKVLDTDWVRMGRKARALRDSRILKEATHLLIFLGIRSDYYEKIAMREAKKGRQVFTVDAKSGEVVHWTL
jgi:hypothetical protein